MSLTTNLASSKLLRPVAEFLSDSAAYRRMGLVADDLIPEQNPIVGEALRRLPKREAYDRMYRIKRAVQASIQQSELEPEQWTKPSEDKPYLREYVAQVEREKMELDAYNNLDVPPQRLWKRNVV
ncbi:ubiquinol-cytochrome C reductase complex 14kD subunit-domain-containing protein [Hyaloraphidium curvatum]|nr:ubiquinol-cytochrome C reductase complex 14kD subunit-domain-containing protein [Hyaloraphidium curvatum]